MSDTAEKIAKLTALALHEATPIDEARTAALRALKLADRLGWALGPKAPTGAPATDYDPADWSRGSPLRETYERIVREQAQRDRDHRATRDAASAKRRADREEVARRARGPNGGKPRRGVLIPKIGAAGPCATCGERIERDAPAWMAEIGQKVRAWHADCADP